jgi:membrane protease YdiL (CAAX protease family)
MGALAWIVTPLLASGESAEAFVRPLLLCLTGGLIWQFVLVLAVVGWEQRSLRWSTLREALWLRAPRSPRTGRVGGKVWLMAIPLVFALAAEELIPALAHPLNRDFGEFLGTDAGRSFLDGNWGWFAVIITGFVFNSVLGEELLFRGLLLPRMQGAFGRWDWVANGVLFAGYHLHIPWAIPAALADTFILAYPSRRYRSALIGIAVHSAQSVVMTLAVLGLVLGA